MKYNDLYIQLVYGPKVAITFGLLHAITYLSSVGFLFTYYAYVLIFSQEKLISWFFVYLSFVKFVFLILRRVFIPNNKRQNLHKNLIKYTKVKL